MPHVSTAYVKNIVRRGFNEVIDPEPDVAGITRLWSYFQSRCAYCGASIERTNREGRIDHAVSASGGGHNGLGNRVLACGPCNDDEKRDEHWESFLKRKNPDPEVGEHRHRIIADWMVQHEKSAQSAAVIDAAQAAAAEVNRIFDSKIAQIKAMLQRDH